MPGPGIDAGGVWLQDEGGERVTITSGKLDVNATLIGGGGDGAILDGADGTIKATVHQTVTETVPAADNPVLVKMGPYLDYDTGAGTDYVGLVGIAIPASGGAVAAGGVEFAAGGYDILPIVPGAQNALITLSMPAGPRSGQTTQLKVASVGEDRDWNPAADDNAMFVRAAIGDEEGIADLLSFTATGYIPDDVTPGARNALLTASMMMGPSSGGGNTDLRPASVLDGQVTEPSSDDNPLFTSEGGRAASVDQDGGQVAVADSTSVQIAAANSDRKYILIVNPELSGGETFYLKFGTPADVNSLPLPPGGSLELSLPAVYTGQITAFQASGGPLNLNVIEF